MSIPTGFKGQISFFMSRCGQYTSTNIIEHEADGKCWADTHSDYVRISAPIEIDVEFYDVRAKQVESLKAAIEAEKSASFARIQRMLGQIQELQAIEAPKP